MINIPQSFTEVLNNLRNSFQASNPDTNPFLRTGFLKSVLDTMAGRFFELFRKAEITLDQTFIATCDPDIVIRHMNEWSQTPETAKTASGQIIVEGTPPTTIPADTELVSTNGIIFLTSVASSIQASTVAIQGITRSGDTATVTSNNHQLATGNTVTITGADQSQYNISATVTVVDINTFTYTVSTDAITPATGTIQFSINRAIIQTEARDAGVNGNIEANTQIDFVQTIPNVNAEARVLLNGFTGGADAETPEQSRQSLLNYIAEPQAPFNEANVIAQIRQEVTTATRIKVYPITPAAGQATIYFVEDGKTNIIPDTATLQRAKDAVVSIQSITGDSSTIFVLAPTLAPQNFTFSSITPDTSTMREAITANLGVYFRGLNIGDDIVQNDYLAAISNTIDTTTGQELQTFALSSQPNDTVINNNELGTLGNVNF